MLDRLWLMLMLIISLLDARQGLVIEEEITFGPNMREPPLQISQVSYFNTFPQLMSLNVFSLVFYI